MKFLSSVKSLGDSFYSLSIWFLWNIVSSSFLLKVLIWLELSDYSESDSSTSSKLITFRTGTFLSDFTSNLTKVSSFIPKSLKISKSSLLHFVKFFCPWFWSSRMNSLELLSSKLLQQNPFEQQILGHYDCCFYCSFIDSRYSKLAWLALLCLYYRCLVGVDVLDRRTWGFES